MTLLPVSTFQAVGRAGDDFHVREGLEGIQEPADALGRVPAGLTFQHAHVGFAAHLLGNVFAQRLGAVALAVANHAVHTGREGFDVRVHQHHGDALVDGLLHQRRGGFLVMGRQDDGIHALDHHILDHFHLAGNVRAAFRRQHEDFHAGFGGLGLDSFANRHVVVELRGGRHVGNFGLRAWFVGHRFGRL